MTLQEYYNFPEGTNVQVKGMQSIYDSVPNIMLPANCTDLFKSLPIIGVYKYDTSQVTNMSNMFSGCTMFSCTYGLRYWDVSNVTNMSLMFRSASKISDLRPFQNWNTSNLTNMSTMFQFASSIKTLDGIKDWDTSKVTDMSSLFYYSTSLIEFDVHWDTSNVKTMSGMFNSANAMQKVCAIDCSSIEQNKYPLYNNANLANIGGFLNMKSSWTDNYGLTKCSKLTYESCINILNGLYDFTGNGATPSSTQGKLKVHANFLTTVGDEISIGTSKGWTITT